MLQLLRFEPLLRTAGCDADSPWPLQDPYERFGQSHFASGCAAVQFEPCAPVIADLDNDFFLPRQEAGAGRANMYTLVLDLDETLVHCANRDSSSCRMRPGMSDFLQKVSALGYEIVIFTTATQDYADNVLDKIDPHRLIHYRLYRQHTLPWGPVCIKDLSRLGRDLNHTMIIDNIADNFMLQPEHGITISDWFEDPKDRALYDLIPLLQELVSTRACVPDILNKYANEIPAWAGFREVQQGARSPTNYQKTGSRASFGNVERRTGGGYPQNPTQAMNQTSSDCWQAPNMAFPAACVPIVVQVHPGGLVNAQASVAPVMFQAAQMQVMSQAPACVAPHAQQAQPSASEEASTATSERAAPAQQQAPPNNFSDLAHGKARRGIQNRKLNSPSKE